MFSILKKPLDISSVTQDALSRIAIDRTKVKILVIDNVPFAYFDILRRHHYDITKWDNINDIRSVSEYEVILSDIKDVGQTLSPILQGAHVIQEIRKMFPAKYIIAYSSHTFEPEYNMYFGYADKIARKDYDSDDWINDLDEAISICTNPIEMWERIKKRLIAKKTQLSIIVKIEDAYVRSINKQQDCISKNRIFNELTSDSRAILNSFIASAIFKAVVG